MEFSKCSQNKRRTLKSVIDRLEDLNLITSADKDIIDRPWYTTAEIKAGIYDLLCKNEYTTGKKILKIINELEGHPKNTEDGANGNELVTHFQHRQIDVGLCLPVELVEYVFGLLAVGDIKNCRLVSRDWNSVGMTALMKRTRIVIGSDLSSRLIPDFYSCFSIPDKQLSAFEICTPFNGSLEEREKWSILQLTGFFDDQQHYMKNLKLSSLYLVKDDIDNEEIVKDFDISPWISKPLIAEPGGQYLTKLSVDSACGGSTKLIVPLHFITHVKELYLEDCILHFSAGVKICPVKLDFERIIFRSDEIDLSNIMVNDIINLSNTKDLTLYCESEETEITLDLSGNLNLQKLSLDSVKTLNWETSKWTVQKMDTRYVDFILNTEMTIIDLRFDFLTIDIFALPQSIERLTIDIRDGDTTVNCSQPIQLNCLKYLKVDPATWLLIFSPFVSCPNLTQLYLNGKFSELEEIKSSCIPKSVRVLKLRGICIKWEEDDPLHIEKLILKKMDYRLVRKLFICKTLVNDLVVELWYFSSDSNLFDFSWEFQQLCCFGEKRLYVGRFDWSDAVPFQESPLYDRVDKVSSCYVFENRKGIKGRAISEKEFIEKTCFT